MSFEPPIYCVEHRLAVKSRRRWNGWTYWLVCLECPYVLPLGKRNKRIPPYVR